MHVNRPDDMTGSGGRRCHNDPMKARRVTISLGLAIAACLLLLETIPRFIEMPGLAMADLDPITFQLERANIEPHPFLAYVNKPNYRSRERSKVQISHNSIGLRGPEVEMPKPKGVFRIVCLGGSSTYGHGPTSNENTWPARLEQHLLAAKPGMRVEVINGGCRGYSTFESLGNYAFRMRDLVPDLVIVYHTVNDMRCALYFDVQRDNTHFRAKWLQAPAASAFPSYTHMFWRRYLTDYFDRFGDLGNFLIVDFDIHLKQLPTGAPPRPRAYTIKDELPPDKARDLRTMMEQDLKNTGLGYRNFYRNLSSIIALAEDDDAPVVLATQAYKPSEDPKIGADEKRAFAEMTGLLRKLAASKDALLVDIQGAVTAESARRVGAKESPLFIDSVDCVEVHLTNDGADFVARVFAEALLQGKF